MGKNEEKSRKNQENFCQHFMHNFSHTEDLAVRLENDEDKVASKVPVEGGNFSVGQIFVVIEENGPGGPYSEEK